MKTAPDQAKKWKCVVVEDEHLAINMMERFITSRSELELIGTAEDQEQFFLLLDLCQPDIIFLDVGIPPGDMDAFHKMQLPKETMLVVVSAHSKDVYGNVIAHTLLSELPKPVSKTSFNKLVDTITL